MADRPQYNSADPPEPTTSLDKLQNYRADCPLQNGGPSAVQLRKTTRGIDASGQILNSTADRPTPLGGLSAVHSANPPETTTSLDKILDSTEDCPLSNSGPSAVQPYETHQRQHRLWTISQTIWRTVRSTIADRPQFNSAKPTRDTSSLDKFSNTTADSLVPNSGPTAVQFCETIRDNNISGQLLT